MKLWIQIFYSTFCVPLYASLILVCHVSDIYIYIFSILNFGYFIKKVKRIHVKLWLIEYKVRRRICIPYIYIGLWNYIIKKWVNFFSSWICSGYECSMFHIFSSLLNLSSSGARLLCWDFTLGFCIVWKLTQKNVGSMIISSSRIL